MIILPKASTDGIRVDTATPTYPWRDLTGELYPDPAGAGSPALVAFRGGAVRAYAYAATDQLDCFFHIPHDWVKTSDLLIHVHWAHNGTAISGNNVMTLAYSAAKGHDQADFTAEKSQAISVSTPNIATIPRWRHRVDEIQLTDATGSGNYLDRTALEPDALILVNLTQTTIPTITGGTSTDPFILTVDLHYQSTGIGTKNRSPDFYT